MFCYANSSLSSLITVDLNPTRCDSWNMKADVGFTMVKPLSGNYEDSEKIQRSFKEDCELNFEKNLGEGKTLAIRRNRRRIQTIEKSLWIRPVCSDFECALRKRGTQYDLKSAKRKLKYETLWESENNAKVKSLEKHGKRSKDVESIKRWRFYKLKKIFKKKKEDIKMLEKSQDIKIEEKKKKYWESCI